MVILRVLQQVTLPSFGMMCLNSLDCAHPFLSFIYFLLPSPSHGVLSFLGFQNLFAIYPSVGMVDQYTIPFTCLLLVLLLDFRSFTGLVSRDKIPQVITIFYLSPHSPPTSEVVLTRFGSLISPYVRLGHQSGSALWLQLCNIWAS